MIIKKQKDRLLITLPQDCTIGKVEADADKLRTKLKGIKNIDISGGLVEEMDTAYFQLLLSLMSTAEVHGMEIHVGQRSEAMDRILTVYGENLAKGEEDTSCPNRS
jgi:ABC-type transporter Mla MlaB component